VSSRTPEEVSDLSQAANLEGLRLIAGGADLRNVPPSGVGEFELSIETGSGRPPEMPGKLLTKVALRITLRAGDKAVVGNMFVEYGLLYSIKPADYERLTDELASAFSIFASPIHAWPQAREFFQNMSSRTGVINVLLPSFKHELFPDFFAAGHRFVEQHRAKVAKAAPG